MTGPFTLRRTVLALLAAPVLGPGLDPGQPPPGLWPADFDLLRQAEEKSAADAAKAAADKAAADKAAADKAAAAKKAAEDAAAQAAPGPAAAPAPATAPAAAPPADPAAARAAFDARERGRLEAAAATEALNRGVLLRSRMNGYGVLAGPGGAPLGSAMLSQVAGGVLIRLDATGLPPGWHGVKLRAGPGCGAAGATPLPALHADGAGRAAAEIFSPSLSLDPPGAPKALVLTAAEGGGETVACAVLKY